MGQAIDQEAKKGQMLTEIQTHGHAKAHQEIFCLQ